MITSITTESPAKVVAEQAAVPKQKSNRPASDLLSGRTGGLLVSVAILFTVLVVKSPTFLTPYTMSILSRQAGFFILIALSQAMCLIVGGMNLSVGAIGGFCTVVLGLCIEKFGMPGWLAAVMAIATGCLVGFVNGSLITRLKIDSFIVTLSMMFVYMGLRSGISSGNPYQVPESFTFLGQGELLGVPYVFFIMFLMLAMLSYIFRNTVFGRHMLATGGNIDAARLSGVKTNSMILWANTLSGGVAAIAAVLWTSKLGSAAPETGDNWLVASFAVAIIGGTGLSGGVFSATGIFLGGVIFMLIKHSLVELRANDYYANAFLGGLILLAIVVDRVRESVGTRDA